MGAATYAMGLKEQIVFPEIDYDKVDEVRGMDIVICTSAKTDDEAKVLLEGSTCRSANDGGREGFGEIWQRKAQLRRTSDACAWSRSIAGKRAAEGRSLATVRCRPRNVFRPI